MSDATLARRRARRAVLVFVLCLLPLVLPTCAGRAYEAIDDAALVLPSTVVVTLESGTPPLVRVRLDDHDDLLFLVDTGSGISCLEPSVARELGLSVLPYASSSSSTGSDGLAVSFDSFTPVDVLDLGGLRLEHFRLPLLELEPARRLGWAGILGQDVLMRLPVVLDAQRGEMHLLPPGSGLEEIKQHLTVADVGDGEWLVLEIDYRPCPYLPLSVVGEPDGLHELLIDTGADGTSFSQPVLDALGLEPVGSYSASSISGAFEGRTYHLEGMNLFGLRISADVQDTSLDHGMLGMDVLGKLVVVFEGEGRRVWLHKRRDAPDDPGLPPDAGDAGDRDAPREH